MAKKEKLKKTKRTVKAKPSAAQLKSRQMISTIAARAKEIYKGKEKEKYSDAVKRAAKELKSEGKI